MTYVGDLQPTDVGVLFNFLSTMDIPVPLNLLGLVQNDDS